MVALWASFFFFLFHRGIRLKYILGILIFMYFPAAYQVNNHTQLTKEQLSLYFNF